MLWCHLIISPKASGILKFLLSGIWFCQKMWQIQKTVCVDCYNLDRLDENLRAFLSFGKHRKTIPLKKTVRCSHSRYGGSFYSCHQTQHGNSFSCSWWISYKLVSQRGCHILLQHCDIWSRLKFTAQKFTSTVNLFFSSEQYTFTFWISLS